jgi:hypothetical protein
MKTIVKLLRRAFGIYKLKINFKLWTKIKSLKSIKQQFFSYWFKSEVEFNKFFDLRIVEFKNYFTYVDEQ